MLSLVGIVAGLVVVGGFLSGRRLDGWAAVFLVTTLLANAGGFAFPFVKLLPSHGIPTPGESAEPRVGRCRGVRLFTS